MNKRILLAAEMCGGRGHAYILALVARALEKRGFEPILAVQKLDTLQPVLSQIAGLVCLQAPVWPGLLEPATYRSNIPAATFGDMIANVGFAAPEAVNHMIRAWDGLIQIVKPALVIADLSPGVLLTVRDRIPTIAIGDGFTLPAATMESFPLLRPEAERSALDEPTLLEIVNGCLKSNGRPIISALPAIFAADETCVGSFAELDFHARLRTHPNAGPWTPDWDRNQQRQGREIFCYFSEPAPFQAAIVGALQHLVRRGLTVRVHIPQLNKEQRTLLAEIGIVAELAPVPFQQIQRQSRLLISHGSLNFISCGLAAGIPQFILPLGIAKRIAKTAIERLGVGRGTDVAAEGPLDPAALAGAILEAYEDESLLQNSIKAAPDFVRRLQPRPAEVVADMASKYV